MAVSSAAPSLHSYTCASIYIHIQIHKYMHIFQFIVLKGRGERERDKIRKFKTHPRRSAAPCPRFWTNTSAVSKILFRSLRFLTKENWY